MSNELLKHLSTTHKRQEIAAIYLPWKSKSTESSTRTEKTARPKEVLNSSRDAENSKDIGVQNVQQGDNHITYKNSITTTKETSRNSKLQRNCPKVKKDDFLWN